MMKRTVQLTGILLMLLLACSMSLSAQRGMRGAADTTHMKHMWMASDTLRRHGMGNRTWMERGRMDHMRQFTGHRNMYGMGMRPGMGFDMSRGNRPMWGDSISGRQFGPGMMMLGSIPNVTEKQKKEITDLMTKQRDEMKKLREEMQTRMKALRDSHRKSILSVLTDEQKKFIDSRSENIYPAPGKTK
jgi:predicted small secreted protein